MRGRGRGTISWWRSDASRKSEKSGIERKRKGNNFVVAVGRIRKKSEKSGNERNRKGNNFVVVGRIRKRRTTSEKPEKLPNYWVSVSQQQAARSIL